MSCWLIAYKIDNVDIMGDSDRQESGVINVMSANDELDQVLNGVIGEMLMISEMIMSTYLDEDDGFNFILV